MLLCFDNPVCLILQCLPGYLSLCSCLFYRDGGELSTRDLQKMVRALPQYSEQIEKLSLHVEVSVGLISISSFRII